MGGFMPPLPERESVAVRDEGVAEDLRHIEILGRLILRQIGKLERQMAENNATLEQVLEATNAQKTVITSMATLLAGIKERLNQALAGELSPAAQAKLNDALAEIQGNTRAITNAVLNNDDDPANDVNEDGTPKNPPADTSKAPTSTTISTSATTITAGEALSLSAGVSAASGVDRAITGTVTFASEGEEIDKAGLDSTGVAAISVSDLPVGDHSITATYSGDAAFASSTSSAVTVSVMPAEQPAPTPTPEPTTEPAPTT
jgi:hypothetical protein